MAVSVIIAFTFISMREGHANPSSTATLDYRPDSIPSCVSSEVAYGVGSYFAVVKVEKILKLASYAEQETREGTEQNKLNIDGLVVLRMIAERAVEKIKDHRNVAEYDLFLPPHDAIMLCSISMELLGDIIVDFQPTLRSPILANPQVTSGPISEFSPCWNVGAVDSVELGESVTIAFEISAGVPIPSSIRFVAGSKPQNELRQSYEAARRAVLRCGAKGTSLPDGMVEITFDSD